MDNEDDELIKAYILAKNNNSRSNERSNETDTLDTSFSTLVWKASSAASHLDAVALDAQSLCSSLSRLHVSAEASVRRVRELDSRRAALQLVLDRTEDLIDLRSCLSTLRELSTRGGSIATGSEGIENIALQLKRFKSIEKTLEVPESDVTIARNAETTLLEQVVRDFDAALERQKEGSVHNVTGTDNHLQSVPVIITKCCQLMSLLGRSDLGVERYVAYISASLDAECMVDLRFAASTGLNGRLMALNVASSLFGRAASALDVAGSFASEHFRFDAGPANVLVTIHSSADKHTSRVILSFARCLRMLAALEAREHVLSASSSSVFDTDINSQSQSQTTVLSAVQASRFLQDIEDSTIAAPFAAATGESHSSILSEFSTPAGFETFLDELALLLQRCASYWRLVLSRAAQLDAENTSSLQTSVESRIRSHHQLIDSVHELGGKFSALEAAFVQGGVQKAIALDEIMEEGVAGASMDLMDGRLPVAPVPISSSNSMSSHSDSLSLTSSSLVSPKVSRPASLLSPNVGSSGMDAAGAYSPGGGALCSTLVEDAFFVFQKSSSRAFATGSAECVSAVINTVVFSLNERIATELDASFRVAVADGNAEVAKVVQTLDKTQADRIQQQRAHILVSSPMRLSSNYIETYQNLEEGHHNGSRGGSLAFSSSGINTNFMSPGGATGNGGGGGGSLKEPSVNPVSAERRAIARLTEETAACALALNNMQLAAECTVRMFAYLETEASATFQDVKELSKVRASISGLNDSISTFRASLEAGVSSLCTRLTLRVRSSLNVFEGASSLIRYELTEASLSGGPEAISSAAFQTEFLPSLAAILAPLQYALTPSLAVSVVTKIASYVAKQIEPRVRRKRFNQVGAIQFEADIRSLISFFAARSSRRAVRDRFARLQLMAQLLTLEDVSDATDFMRSSSGELGNDEARAILALRVDLSPEAITNLIL
jgi:hypothetical protein